MTICLGMRLVTKQLRIYGVVAQRLQILVRRQIFFGEKKFRRGEREVDDGAELLRSSDEGAPVAKGVTSSHGGELMTDACEEGSSDAGCLLFGDEVGYERAPHLRCGRTTPPDSCSSSEFFGEKKLRRGKRRRQVAPDPLKQDLAEESKAFLPVAVDKHRCLALLWNQGRGQLQCSNPPVDGNFCRVHRAFRSHGTVDGSEPIPRRKLDLFRGRLAKPGERGGPWYTRAI